MSLQGGHGAAPRLELRDFESRLMVAGPEPIAKEGEEELVRSSCRGEQKGGLTPL